MYLKICNLKRFINEFYEKVWERVEESGDECDISHFYCVNQKVLGLELHAFDIMIEYFPTKTLKAKAFSKCNNH